MLVSDEQEKNIEEKGDGITLAMNDDMFAFSQIVAQGGNVAKTVSELEKTAKEFKE